MMIKKIVLAGMATLTLSVSTAFAEVKEYSVSTVLSDAYPWGQTAEKWAELVAKRSGGKIRLKIYPNAQLVSGDQTREFSAMRSGLIDMAVGSTINWSTQVPELNLFSLPFLMPDDAAVDAITQGEAGAKIFSAIAKRGVKPLAWGENGFREISNSRQAIQHPHDLKGLKIRVVGSPLFLDTFNALGANPTQMSWTDAQPALTTGAVDGQENPLSVYDAARADRASQRYLTLWHYMNDPLIFGVNQRLWRTLSKKEQRLLTETAIEAGQWGIQKSRAERSSLVKKIRDRGVEVIELSEQNREAFVEATQSVYQKWTPKIGADLVKKAQISILKR